MLRVLQKDRACFIWMVAIIDVCVKLWVERLCVCVECVLSVMYCIVLEAFAWPSPAVCDQITVSLLIPSIPPSFFTLAYSLFQFPSSRSLSLLFPCIHQSVLVIPLSKLRGTEKELAVGPPCLCALISYAEELYITNPLRKTHAI